MPAKRNSARRDRFRAIIARTKPNCHICGEAIDWEANYLDPRSFELDHVIPLARGGEDALSNALAAHRQPCL